MPQTAKGRRLTCQACGAELARGSRFELAIAAISAAATLAIAFVLYEVGAARPGEYLGLWIATFFAALVPTTVRGLTAPEHAGPGLGLSAALRSAAGASGFTVLSDSFGLVAALCALAVGLVGASVGRQLSA